MQKPNVHAYILVPRVPQAERKPSAFLLVVVPSPFRQLITGELWEQFRRNHRDATCHQGSENAFIQVPGSTLGFASRVEGQLRTIFGLSTVTQLVPQLQIERTIRGMGLSPTTAEPRPSHEVAKLQASLRGV